MTMRDELPPSQFAEALQALHGIQLTPGAARLLSSVDAGSGRLTFSQFQRALQEEPQQQATSGRPVVLHDQAQAIITDNAGSPKPPALKGDHCRPHTDISGDEFVKATKAASKLQALGPFQSNLVVPSNDPSINNPLVHHQDESEPGDSGRDMLRLATRMFISGELDRASYEQFLIQQGILLTSDCDLQRLIVSHERAGDATFKALSRALAAQGS